MKNKRIQNLEEHSINKKVQLQNGVNVGLLME